jgi:uncharacterized repeat protein (TIGR01451 family)
MGVIELKVRGARLEVTKSLDDQSIILGEVIKVKVEVRNVGEAVAKNVRLVDKPPANFKIEGDITTKVEELNPGEAIEIVYKMKPNQAGSYSSGVAVIEWEDELGNEYLLESKDLGIDVKEPIVLPELTKPPETTQPPVSPTATPAAPTLTKSEVVLTAALTVIIMTILIRLLTLSRAAAKE